MTVYHFFLYFALLNGVGLIVALLSRREGREGGVFLAVLIAAILYSMSMEFLTNTGSIRSYPYFIGTQLPAALLVPALMYLYVLALTTPNFVWQRKYWLHFIPFGIAVARYAIKNLFWPQTFYAAPSAYGIEWYIVVIAAISIYVAYLLACIEQLKHFHSQLHHYFSELSRVRLHWLQYLLILLSIPWLLALLDVVTGPYLVVEHFATAAVALTILLIGLYGFRQSVIFAAEEDWGHPYHEHLAHIMEKPLANSSAGAFSLEELAHWKTRLEQYVQEQRPYLNPQLRLVDLAHGLNLKAYQVSEILNRGFGTTFYEFISRHRIEEAEKRLLDPRYAHLSILGIANDSGFNSKSVFNESFRRATGMTPSSFRKARPTMSSLTHH